MHQWCEDHGFTPYVAVAVDATVRVPAQYVSADSEIVLNVSHAATHGLVLGNEALSFQARFGGVPHLVHVPVGRVIAIYARENGQGMAFPAEAAPDLAEAADPPSPPPPSPPGGRPALRRIK